MGEIINDIYFPTIPGGFLNNATIKTRIPKQVYHLQWFLHRALRFYPVVSLLGRGTYKICSLPVLGD